MEELGLTDEPTILQRKFHANTYFRNAARRLLAVHNTQKHGALAGWGKLEQQKQLFHRCKCETPCPLAHYYRRSLDNGAVECVLLNDRCAPALKWQPP